MSLGHQMPLNGEESVSLVSSGPNPNVLEERGEVPRHARGCKLSREGERERGRKPLHTEWTQRAMRGQRDGCIPNKLGMQPGGPSRCMIKVNNACQELLIRETGLDQRLKFDCSKRDQRL